jgi:NAD(P)-dependent dehydrogenase (short-subunit alcohol dehydrogenase family)
MEYPSFGLTPRVAVVTGASRGIGHDLALALSDAGATVVATGRDAAAVAEVVEQARSEGGDAHGLIADLADPSESSKLMDRVVDEHGRIDILVNNAGLGTNHDVLDITPSDWDELMDVNLRGLFFTTQAAARHMVSQGYGRIINMSSQAAQVALPRHVVYCTSKGGVEQLTRALALEWASSGVTVNAVAPTFIRTPGTAERLDEPAFLQDVLARIPIGRVGTTTDVAAAVIYLASDAAGLVTGSVLPVDGGWTIQ